MLVVVVAVNLGAAEHPGAATHDSTVAPGAPRAIASPRADGFSAGPGWKVNLGAAYSDTFSFGFEDVLPVAAEALANTRWRVQSADTATGRIVTEWQPVRHLFVRLFLGEVRERCVVDVTPLGPRRSLVKFRAALATRKSLVGNPLMPSVRKEYKNGVRDWQRKVRVALAERSRMR